MNTSDGSTWLASNSPLLETCLLRVTRVSAMLDKGVGMIMSESSFGKSGMIYRHHCLVWPIQPEFDMSILIKFGDWRLVTGEL